MDKKELYPRIGADPPSAKKEDSFKISHPSIRVKGTENEFDPVDCNDIQCSIKSFHMHCPFCVKTESYQDSRILKAHYHVKHVDKGIEFGGLKILRCCERCDIVGAIKEEKKFKGAHWHCFICKNGFNRRDEAIKHYKTHFRHPCTTLQIHVPQVKFKIIFHLHFIFIRMATCWLNINMCLELHIFNKDLSK
ncbi:uncharacterized protein LOC111613310 [Centruroides sculpturatus]|uniref:uncharacterized protein LOC111613310 n=1 Tax=Centruroides sculpturatus TaxID=218467 RepID=UPI000C6E19AC|nr:uncharacterized protein LOC111613310 [Centruroides sculpturatus]